VEDVRPGQLYNGQNIYVIPTYQRPYAWRRDQQVTELWEDISDAQKIGLDYFLGAVYLAPLSNNNLSDWKRKVDPFICEELDLILSNSHNKNMDPINIYLLLDGQQRLVTLSLLLYHLQKNSISVDWINANGDLKQLTSLFLNGADYQYYTDLLNGKAMNDKTLSQRKLKEAFDFFEKTTSRLSEMEKKQLLIFIKSKLVLAKILLLKENFDIQLFQTQNDRGKQLTYLERFKSILMFYDERNGGNMASKIHSAFGSLYPVLDESAKQKILQEEDVGENSFLKIFYVYLESRQDKDDTGMAWKKFMTTISRED